ncbi:MAG: helix-hairpin-helix domain-containing protein [Clostridia bacterium]|nr:helix-hairpin-helix domain-containing protein [Clostridia bacterium]
MKLSKAEIAAIVITVIFIAAVAIAALRVNDKSAAVTISSGLSPHTEQSETPASDLQTPSASPELLVNINTAEAQELCLLPGIGETIAARIVDYRTEHGQFNSTDEIMNVSGIGAKTYEDLKGYITIG